VYDAGVPKPDPPDGTDPTLAAPISGAEPTLAAPVSGADPTVAAPASGADATQLTAVSPSDVRSQPRSQPRSGSGSATRKVGEEIASASISRFGSVGRDRFEVLDELARGGLGRVFRARDPRTGRILAIKEVLHPSPDIVARFAREALVTANLQHPSIVPVYEVGTWNGGEPFYAMKLVAGRTLDRVISEATTTDARVALVPHVIAIADALAYAHSERVIHRDLKPSNVIVGSYGETVVIDWGLAKNLTVDDPDESLESSGTIPPDNQETVAGSVLGTPAYMPPEQARGERLDEHADVYAIGAILYHLLTGKRPFAEVTEIEVLIERVANGSPRSIVELAPSAPSELVAIAEKAMARDPHDRYPTAEGLAADLRRYQAGKLVGAHRYSRVQLLRRWIAHHAAAVSVATVAVLVLTVSGVIAVRRIATERDEAQHQGSIARANQVAAEAANATAKRRLADTLEELGRQALVDELPERALPLIAASAATRDTPTTTIGLLAAQARAAYGGIIAVAPSSRAAATSGGLAAGGTCLVISDKDGHVSRWDLAARRTRWEVDAGLLIAIAPDGAQFLATTVDGTLSLRSVEDGASLASWAPTPDGRAPATALAWAADSKRFAVSDSSGRIVLGTPGQQALVEAGAHRGAVEVLAFSPDGTRIAAGGADGVNVIDARSGATVTTLGGAGRETAAIVWVDNDQLVVGDGGGTTELWNVGQRRVVRRFELGRALYALAVGADGSGLAAAGDGSIVRLWSLATGELRSDLAEHELGVNVVVAAGEWLVTGDELGVIRVWDPHTGERVHAFPSEEQPIAFDARNGLFAAIARRRQRVWRLAPDALVRRISAHTGRIRALEFGPDGTLYSASLDGTGAVIDIARGTVRRLGSADGFVEQPIRSVDQLATRSRPNPRGVRSLALSPDGGTVALVFEDGRIELYDRTGAPRGSWRGHTGRVRQLVFAPDGKTAYSVGDNTLRAWDVATGTERGKVTLAGAGWDVTLLGGGATVATLSETPAAVQLWRATDLVEVPISPPVDSTLSELLAIGSHVLVSDKSTLTTLEASGAVSHTAAQTLPFSADVTDVGGRSRLAVGASNGRIVLYDGATLAPLRDLQFGNQVIVRLGFRPDGNVLAAVSSRRVQLFDPETGRLLAQLPELPVLLSQLAWSRDGRYLAVAGAGGTVWVWDVAPADARELDAFGACVSPWRLEDTTLVKKPFDPERCSVLQP
jgi:WD40 repeat protein/tRNA A-37 threonylcarbamoyl transferase component Bud32